MLMALLESLLLPTDLNKQATKIGHQIETGIDDAQLPVIINDISYIISTLASQVVTKKHDYEEFLRSLTSCLNELDLHIRITVSEDDTPFEQRKGIGQVV
ncbi:MAG: hypothetical protein ACJAS1_006415 [Oleiphilaceae bacterium]|jgi:hypothetical protein